ncbi:MAG: uridine diphosphate-N-acetylglucosamine-binding protein YvcK [bacterium]|nr:uridine diphosphate-N-acetylglucosamine-binding protein YvcK [bacterium]
MSRDETTTEPSSAHPRRVVALGGGTGLPAVLRGLRDRVTRGVVEELTAVVAMSDDGGSSGRLRRTRGMPPPGDVRNCLVALSEDEDLLAGLFQHRYEGSEELGGHNLGNLILAALAEQTGSFLSAVEMSSRVLRTAGRILPVTHDDVHLVATLEDGSRIDGESLIETTHRRIRSVRLDPHGARPTPGVVEAIREADLVVIGPGSLFTSVLPTLVLEEISTAMRETSAVRTLVGNLVSERGADSGLEVLDHRRIIEQHAGGRIVDAVLVNEATVESETLQRYKDEGATPLTPPDPTSGDVHVVRRNLLAPGAKLRHDPAATTAGLVRAWCDLALQAGVRGRGVA